MPHHSFHARQANTAFGLLGAGVLFLWLGLSTGIDGAAPASALSLTLVGAGLTTVAVTARAEHRRRMRLRTSTHADHATQTIAPPPSFSGR